MPGEPQDLASLLADVPGAPEFVKATVRLMVASGKAQSDEIEAKQAQLALDAFVAWIWTANAWLDEHPGAFKEASSKGYGNAVYYALDVVRPQPAVMDQLVADAKAKAADVRSVVAQGVASGTLFWHVEPGAKKLLEQPVQNGVQDGPPPADSVPASDWLLVKLTGRGDYGKASPISELPDEKRAVAWQFASNLVKEQIKLKTALSQAALVSGGPAEYAVQDTITAWWLGEGTGSIPFLKKPKLPPPLKAGPVKQALDLYAADKAEMAAAVQAWKAASATFKQKLADAGYPEDDAKSVYDACGMVAEVEAEVALGKYLADKAAAKLDAVKQTLATKQAKSTAQVEFLTESRKKSKAKLDAAKKKAQEAKDRYGEGSDQYRQADAERNLALREWQDVADQGEGAVRGSNRAGAEAFARRNDPDGGVYARVGKAKDRIAKAKKKAAGKVKIVLRGKERELQVLDNPRLINVATTVEKQADAVQKEADKAGEEIKDAADKAAKLLHDIKKGKTEWGMTTAGTEYQQGRSDTLGHEEQKPSFPWLLVAAAAAKAAGLF